MLLQNLFVHGRNKTLASVMTCDVSHGLGLSRSRLLYPYLVSNTNNHILLLKEIQLTNA